MVRSSKFALLLAIALTRAAIEATCHFGQTCAQTAVLPDAQSLNELDGAGGPPSDYDPAQAAMDAIKEGVLLTGCAGDEDTAIDKAKHRCTEKSCDSFTWVAFPMVPPSKRNWEMKDVMSFFDTVAEIDYDKCPGQQAYIYVYKACEGTDHKDFLPSLKTTKQQEAAHHMAAWCTPPVNHKITVKADTINGGVQTGDGVKVTNAASDRDLEAPVINAGVISGGVQTGDHAHVYNDMRGQKIINTKQYKECEGSGNGGEKGAAQAVCCKSKATVCCTSAAQSNGTVKVEAPDCPPSHPYAGKWEQGEEVLKSGSGPWAPLALGGCAFAALSGVGWALRRSRRPHGLGGPGEAEDSGLAPGKAPTPEEMDRLLEA